MELSYNDLVFKADLTILQLKKDKSETAKVVYDLFIKALEGDALSAKLIADCYYDGNEVYKSHTNALYWYRKAKESGIDTSERISEIEKKLI